MSTEFLPTIPQSSSHGRRSTSVARNYTVVSDPPFRTPDKTVTRNLRNQPMQQHNTSYSAKHDDYATLSVLNRTALPTTSKKVASFAWPARIE